jgi:hypothetical protein
MVPDSASGTAATDHVLKRGLAALVAATVVNVAIVAVAAGPLALASDFDPLNVPPVALFTVLGVIGATATYLVLDRVVDDTDRVFTLVAAAVLLLSFLPDIALLRGDPNATLPAVIALMLMHVVAAVACVAALTGRIAALEDRLA